MTAFTPEQRAVVERRSGSVLVSANAGSGKTSVMVERFVEAVREDGVPVDGILAITFGHVVLGVSHSELAEARDHEHAHVRQYERWGVLFFPLYLGSSGAQLVRGRHPYHDNAFERQACQAAASDEDRQVHFRV